IQIGKPYKMVSRDLHPETTVVKVGTVPVGRDTFTLIAGPCAVENPEQTMRAIRAAKEAGATIVRGDVYKPRTSPYSFQGLGEQAVRAPDPYLRAFDPQHPRSGRDGRRAARVASPGDRRPIARRGETSPRGCHGAGGACSGGGRRDGRRPCEPGAGDGGRRP